MKRPKYWYDLPYDVMEDIVNSINIDKFIHKDPHNKLATINEILTYTESINSRYNSELIQEKYNNTTDKVLIQIIKNNIAATKYTLEVLNKFLQD